MPQAFRRGSTSWRSLRPPQRHAFVACFLGWTLDSFDYFLLVFSIPAISAEFHASTPAVANALFLTLAFRPIGALLFGAMAEHYGRRPTLMFNIACYSALQLACCFAPSLSVLLVLRALFGVAMGGEWGVGAALAFETLPAEGRGFYSGVLQQGYSFGALLASMAFGVLFLPLSHVHAFGHSLGWRGLFALGALPALLTLYIGSRVEESPVWLARRRALRVPVPWFASVRRHGRLFLFLILLMTGFNAFSHGSMDLYPTFLIRDRHAGPHATGLIGVVLNLGAIAGGITFGSLSEHWGRKRTILTAALLAIPCVPLYAFAHSLTALATGAFLLLFMVQGAWGVVPAYLNELSPPSARAVFPGLAYQLGNLLASRISVFQGRIALRFGALGPVLACTVVLVAVSLSVVTSLGREPKGERLAE